MTSNDAFSKLVQLRTEIRNSGPFKGRTKLLRQLERIIQSHVGNAGD